VAKCVTSSLTNLDTETPRACRARAIFLFSLSLKNDSQKNERAAEERDRWKHRRGGETKKRKKSRNREKSTEGKSRITCMQQKRGAKASHRACRESHAVRSVL